jgi:hypothetical protein
MDTEDGAQGPETAPFTYVFVPADEARPAQEQRYEGTSDAELRNRLRAYFARVGGCMNDSHKRELASSLRARVEAQKNKQGQQQQQQKSVVTVHEDGAAPAATVATGTAGDAVSAEAHAPMPPPPSEADLLARAVETTDDGAFEIVPIVLPTLRSRFLATSLYIDSTGMIKDLPMNTRASRIAGREVRGDAFLLSNHDDPALDTWKRVDATLADYEGLLSAPPASGALNVDDPAQANAALSMREALTRVVSAEDAAAALAALDAGRAAFARQDFASAAASFLRVVELVAARTDLLANEADVVRARNVAHLNLAQCALKLGRFGDAEKHAAEALRADPGNDKAAFRLATAKMHLNDHEGSLTIADRHAAAAQQQVAALRGAVDAAASTSSSSAGSLAAAEASAAAWTELHRECGAAKQRFAAAEKNRYRGMFG